MKKMQSDLQVFIRGTPKPQGSKTAKVSKYGRAVMWEAAKGIKEWRAHCERTLTSWRLSQKEFAAIGCPVNVALEFCFRIPKSKSRKVGPGAPHNVKPDLSKLVRAIEDALVEAKILSDDALVCEINARKVYGFTEGVDIKLTAYESE